MPKTIETLKSASNLIWIDLEMTGLDPEQDVIIEIATLITDKNLNLLAEGPVCAVHQTDATLAAMDDWNTQHHGRSGLTQRVRESQVNIASAETQTLDFIMQYVSPSDSPMCGNSICQDRRFLWKYMPTLEDYFFYRNIDVSTIKELAKRWKTPEALPAFKKKSHHLALDDIYESVAELKYYREHFFID